MVVRSIFCQWHNVLKARAGVGKRFKLLVHFGESRRRTRPEKTRFPRKDILLSRFQTHGDSAPTLAEFIDERVSFWWGRSNFQLPNFRFVILYFASGETGGARSVPYTDDIVAVAIHTSSQKWERIHIKLIAFSTFGRWVISASTILKTVSKSQMQQCAIRRYVSIPLKSWTSTKLREQNSM